MMPSKDGLPCNLTIFLYYFVPATLFVVMMLNRTILLKFVLKAIDYVFRPIRVFVARTDRNIQRLIDKINAQEFAFFTRGDDIATLNKVMLYISKNEHTKRIKIATVLEKGQQLPENFEQEISFLDREYPEIDIEFVQIEGKFSPQLIHSLSEKWNIPINFMFIGSPSNKFLYRIEELGGVRLII